MPNVFPGAKNAVIGTQSLESWDHADAHNKYEDKLGITGSTDSTTPSFDWLARNHTHSGSGMNGPQIGTAGIADLAVNVNKIVDNAVQTAKISTGAVTTPKIADNNVTLVKLEQRQNFTVIGKSTTGSGTPGEIGPAGASEVLRMNSAGTTLAFGQVGNAGIQDDAITYAKMQNGVVGTMVLGVAGSSAGSIIEEITSTADGQVLRRASGVLGFGAIGTAGIQDDAVTFAKFRNIDQTRLLGRFSSGTGDVEMIQIGSGLSLSVGGVLTATGGGGTGTTDHSVLTNRDVGDQHPQYVLESAYIAPRWIPVTIWSTEGQPPATGQVVQHRFYFRESYVLKQVSYSCWTPGSGNNRIQLLKNATTFDTAWNQGSDLGIVMTTSLPNLDGVNNSICSNFNTGADVIGSGDYFVPQINSRNGPIENVNIVMWCVWE